MPDQATSTPIIEGTKKATGTVCRWRAAREVARRARVQPGQGMTWCRCFVSALCGEAETKRAHRIIAVFGGGAAPLWVAALAC